MFRDFKFLGRNSGKNSNSDETENIPVNPRDIPANQPIADSNRAPLNSIPEQIQNCKAVVEQEVGVRSIKPDRTPTKAKGKASDSGVPFRTPEKPGAPSKARFGWAQKNESGSLVSESSRGGGTGNGVANFATPRSNRAVGKANSTYSESNSTQSTPTKSVCKPPNPGFSLGNGSRAIVNGAARNGSYAALSKGLPITCGTSTVVNTTEVPYFELREDPSFWMEHNVQVLIRVRPLNSMERSMNGYSRCLKQESAQCITWIGQPETRFTFDHVACETVDQETLFRMVGLPMIENCLSGYNSCMFAYGQTGSGKTHTMLGEIDELEVKPSPNRGMTPRIFEFLFARIRAEEESRRDERLKYSCKCSFLEIYNEQVADLLDPSSTNLQLREDSKNGVYVENLSEFEVHTVGDILKLLIQGSSNRKVATTNMNRESSRSHSVFTCIIESRWEKDSTSNLRFARLNLVDLAGSERQKSSGAEGERLKEAANINKSLSTLGHVIMVLLDVAHGKPRHIPYRDSRLTFLLQDSLGGNSKTMIIANVSPSICCAAETLNTLKFAQRAKLIQNNAVVNEDSSGDVIALQNQIRLLKEELSALKHHNNVSRSLSFGPPISAGMKLEHGGSCVEKAIEMDRQQDHSLIGSEPKGHLRMSTKQLKSLESTLAGALRREQMAETSIKQLEAEIEQLNRLVRQREEDSRCTKMMLKFREDKIQRMESLVGGLMPADSYLREENSALSEEIQLLQAKVDRNPEVTRFALENIRLLEQVRRFQDLYQEGEREMLLEEISELRNQLAHCLDGNPKQHSSSKMFMPHQFDNTLRELEECRKSLTSCLEKNAELSREIEVLRASLHLESSAILDNDSSVEVIKEPIVEVPPSSDKSTSTFHEESTRAKHGTLVEHSEEFMDLLLEVDILKIILKEERAVRVETEERGMLDLESVQEKLLLLTRRYEDVMEELKEANSVIEALESQQLLSINEVAAQEKLLLVTRQYEDVKEELKEANSVIEALESQQLLSINEVEDLRNSNSRLQMEISNLNGQVCSQELKDVRSLKSSASENSPLQVKLKRIQSSLEKAKKLNAWYQGDRACQASNEEEMDEVRRQVEAETAEVIVCLQEELNILQQQVDDSNLKETQTEEKLVLLQNQSKELQESLCFMTDRNKELCEKLEEKEKELRTLSEELQLVTREIEVILADGHNALDDASHELDYISDSLHHERYGISEHFSRIRNVISEKELLIQGLHCSLEEAKSQRFDLEGMLRSLRGATLVITEAHQEECSEKEEEIVQLSSQLSSQASNILDLENRIKQGSNELQKASLSATVAFVIVNRFSEMNSAYLEALESKEASLKNQAAEFDRVEKEILSLRKALDMSEETCGELRLQLSVEMDRACVMEQKLAGIHDYDIVQTSEKLMKLKDGVSTLQSCVNEYGEKIRSPDRGDSEGSNVLMSNDEECDGRRGDELNKQHQTKDLYAIQHTKTEKFDCSSRSIKDIPACSSIIQKDATSREATLTLLKNELESALESLKGVQKEMVKLRIEKEEVLMSGQQSHESTKSILNQVLSLQDAMTSFEKQLGFQLVSLDQKLQKVEDAMQEFGSCLFEEQESLEFELHDAKVVAAQKTAEASCILAKFEEAQDTMREADIVINELMISNETLKLEIEEARTSEVILRSEKDVLVREVQKLEKQEESDLSEMKNLILDLEGIASQAQFTSMEGITSIHSDILSMKSQFQETTKLMHSWIEEIWSETLVKDCSLSVLHLCHIGILLERLTGLNAENGLLYQGLSESNSVMSELREHNFKVKGELEMCRILKGKLLADIKNGFDRISRKEDETGELSIKLTGFEKKILHLQLQEELMLQRSNHMGSELASLMEELDMSRRNMLAALHNQETMVKMQEEVLSSQEEIFAVDLCAKDFELLILASEYKQTALQRGNLEEACQISYENIENLKSDLIVLHVDAELKEWIKGTEVALLENEAEDKAREIQELISELSEKNATIAKMSKINEVHELGIQSLKAATLSNDSLKGEVTGLLEAKNRLVSQVRELDAERGQILEDMKAKETALGISSACISALEQQIEVLQIHLKTKDAELKNISFLEGENESLETELRAALQGLGEKKAEVGSLSSHITEIEGENRRLQDNTSFLEKIVSQLENDLILLNVELKEAKDSQSVIRDELSSKRQDLEIYTDKVNSLEVENVSLKQKLQSVRQNNSVFLAGLRSTMVKSSHSIESMNMVDSRRCSLLERISVLEKYFEELCENLEITSKFVEELECLENSAQRLTTENSELHTELSRKEDVVEGLLFDLSLLQESASKDKDVKDENEELAVSLEALEDDLAARSDELDQAVTKSELLEMQLQEKEGIISSLQLEISKLLESTESLSCKNRELTAIIEETLEAKRSTEEELFDRRNANETLEIQLIKMDSDLVEMNNSIESLTNDLDAVVCERDDLRTEVLFLRENLDIAEARAEEIDTIAAEAQEMAERRKIYAEEKEEEVKLLERSVDELEYTINVLENKVDIVQGEAERQRMDREDLESELLDVKQQMHHLESNDADIRRLLDMKEKHLGESLQRIELLEREIAAKDSEIAKCKSHIAELNLHAEAQATEYKQKFKTLEAMVEQVRSEGSSSHASSSSSSVKLEKNGPRPRGSGSPFKCIGLGMAHQVKSDRDEELAAARFHIEELEALAANRQKEIFMLNSRLATAESMTHDVIRDLLGLKLDMTNYASLLDNQLVQKITEKARLKDVDAPSKDDELTKLKQQLNEFIQERKGWLEEIDRKQAEMVAAQVALEKLRQRDRLLTAENEMFKMESVNHKRQIRELEDEMKKLSGQQNLHQRIHHHAKIKEENNQLKTQNEDLNLKLRRTEAILIRVKEELAHYRNANGRSPCINFNEEERLNNLLKETEDERLQLAQKLVGLCTSILKAAGIARPASDVNVSAAEEALEGLSNRVTSLERDLDDVKYKNKITNERMRLSELMPQTSPVSERQDENRHPSNRQSRSPCLSSLDR